ncbi:MAG: hypothetical protein PVH61_31580 [Candidatus Aminicenantes bacterium]|jgi:hypothetical protein
MKVYTTAEIYKKYDECHYDEIHGCQQWVKLSDVATLLESMRQANVQMCPNCKSKLWNKEKENVSS